MITGTLTPATHFPDMLSKQTEASAIIVSSEMQSLGGHMQNL